MQVITPLSFREQACVIDIYSFLFHESRGPMSRESKDSPDPQPAQESIQPVVLSGPWFEEFELGDLFADAPAITITEGHTALYQAIFGDRQRLPLDAPLCASVSGLEKQLVNTGLVCNVAIGQTTFASQRVMGNLFYRGMIFKSPVYIGDTLSTTTKVVALRQNRVRKGRAASGMVALEVEVKNQWGGQVMLFWRCPMIPCKDPDADTGRQDSFDQLPQELSMPDLVHAVPDWDLNQFSERVNGSHFQDLTSGSRFIVESQDTVTSAPELARLTLNMAMTHLDASKSVYGKRLVYGGHTISIAAAQMVRALPAIITVIGWRSCDHLAPVFEQDLLRSEVTLGEKRALESGGGLVNIQIEVYATRGSEAPERGDNIKVLDWHLVGLFA